MAKSTLLDPDPVKGWQVRRLKALGLGPVFLPLEYIYLATTFQFNQIGFLVIVGTVLFLLGYAMTPEADKSASA